MNTVEAPAVVAGFDGTQPSFRAVLWAAAEAARRRCVLVIARALDWSWPAGAYPEVALAPLTGDPELLRREAGMQTTEVVREIGHSYPDLDVRTVLLEDFPGPALAGYARDTGAAMLVVGPPGTGALTGAVFGSTTAGLSQHSERPLVVVRGDEPTAGTTGCPVVVGLETGADNSAALAFALDFAQRHAVPAHLVHTTSARSPAGPSEAMAAELADWLSTYPAVPFEHEVVRDRPERALLRRAAHAALLVVGDRRRNAFRRALCGSVSRTVVHHAPCPVSVVEAGI